MIDLYRLPAATAGKKCSKVGDFAADWFNVLQCKENRRWENRHVGSAGGAMARRSRAGAESTLDDRRDRQRISNRMVRGFVSAGG
ncbi:MAG: hypothetical protein V9E94_03545 [Microthrixaceae bacterium]